MPFTLPHSQDTPSKLQIQNKKGGALDEGPSVGGGGGTDGVAASRTTPDRVDNILSNTRDGSIPYSRDVTSTLPFRWTLTAFPEILHFQARLPSAFEA